MRETAHTLLELIDEITRVLLRVTVLTRLVPETLDRALGRLGHSCTSHVTKLHLMRRPSLENILSLSEVELILMHLKEANTKW